MRACLFVGPTLRPDDLPADLAVLPPAAQGDVYRIAQSRPQAIGIVDGYFEGVLAVWHKEILWAMAEGIHVFGSASMGALRAAELHAFGMQGVGRIFEAYQGGELEDDDEVAVIHGPAETSYLALSEAMVNIRRTLAEATSAGIIGRATRDDLVRIGKALFYHDRSFERLFSCAAAEGAAGGEIEALRTWLPTGRIDQKRQDALAMIEAMRALLARDPEPMRVDYTLEWTRMWDDVTAAAAGTHTGAVGDATRWVADERLLEELRLEPEIHAAVRERALLKYLARREADRHGHPADAGAAREILTELRARHSLLARADLDRWLAANDLDADRLAWLSEEEAQLRAALRNATPGDRLLDELRLRDDYARFADRARHKQACLRAVELEQPTPEDAGVMPAQLLAWYFEGRLGRPIPDDVEQAARDLGFASRAELYRALLREWLYCRAERTDSPAGSPRCEPHLEAP